MGSVQHAYVDEWHPCILDYHVVLCEQAGFVVGDHKHGRDTRWQLTWQGHDHLDENLRRK